MDFNISQLLGHLIIYIVVFLFAVSIHEAAHAWVSHRWGDDTAYLLGRVTLNPVAHTDPIGTLLLPIIGFVAGWAGGGAVPLMAWGKPTPVNPRNWTNYKWGNVCVSVAGVTANFIVVIVVFIIFKTLFLTHTVDPDDLIDIVNRQNSGITLMTPVLLLLWYSITLNLSLVIFNLLPFPPLDGSGILSSFLPDSYRPIFDMMEQYGFLILLILIMTRVTSYIMMPFFKILIFFLFNFN
jgi:Zn-dependent protease